ncbi:hypothetical protein [Janthinobacterium sp. Ant5-2-1]|uniref:hypothetical protein n=1 Tax=Janthinobacterium sp. Ant5-2-1 TaxID=1755239 RepID=UPI000AD7AA8D|nr:hypothetical protein [Janthinobacterium sp. Ant5-2-1]
MCVTAAFHRTGKETTAELQAPLLTDKATLAGEAAEDLLAIETQQHHGDEA